MAVGRLQAALAAATSEVTVAAANLNFDFTLVKYEAPKEYQALGSILSAKRKDNAELGSSHRLARQLGALFEGICPATPALLQAYGTRVSEIAKASKGISEPYVNTLFSEYTGIDGTSIWAAATSSKSALHVHLLACILARMWTAQEAVAIWVELVAGRRKEIACKLEEGEPLEFSLAAAAGQEISRAQLAMLDTSARAWLRTADEVFRHKQKQLELILKNIDLPVNDDSKVFPSVIKTWKTSVQTMCNLISGIPQAVQSGATLLGLSAWHIYPNISVYSSGIVEVDMSDPLVNRGGILSLGLLAAPRTPEKDSGVYWSLSLAQLRHYGRPVQVERGLSKETRLTLSQLSLVIFAALIMEWELSSPHDDEAARITISLADFVEPTEDLNSVYRFLKLLRDGASAYLHRATSDKDLTRKLIQLGRRKSRSLIYGDIKDGHFEKTSCLFNLLSTERFMKSFKHRDSQITFLRHVTTRLARQESSPDTFIIRYVQSPDEGLPLYAFATALPMDSKGQSQSPPHHRWLPGSSRDTPLRNDEITTFDAEVNFSCLNDSVQIVTAQDPAAYTYYFLLGDLQDAALFARNGHGLGLITINDLQWCLEHGLLDEASLVTSLLYPNPVDKVMSTLHAYGFAAEVYDNLFDATIDVGVLNRPLAERLCSKARNVDGSVDLQCTFSLIAYFESGIHDIHPHQLKDVIAISSANSLFVSGALIQDPHKSASQKTGVRRILGNISKPGMTFLLPPQEPLVREVNSDSWRMCDYGVFDGTNARSFENTSVHLSFTEYHVPFFDGSRGTHDNQLSFLESVISVRDKGAWVADVDPFPLLTRYGTNFTAHRHRNTCKHRKDINSNQNITAIDNWDELLDPPRGPFVVRTGINWVARFALALVAHQRLREKYTDFAILLCSEDVCWPCIHYMPRYQAYIY